jgi:hypothetical protein
MAAKPLRAVGPDEKPPAADPPKTVSQAAESGTTRELLVAMRNRIARAVESDRTAARDLAALTKRLAEVVKEIEAIDVKLTQEAREDAIPGDEEWDASSL